MRRLQPLHAAVRAFTARVAGVVFPGETIRVRAWREENGVVLDAGIGDGEHAGAPVLSDCVVSPA